MAKKKAKKAKIKKPIKPKAVPLAMAETCINCGVTTSNDDPSIGHPIDFLASLRALGWHIPDTQYPSLHSGKYQGSLCPACASSS